MKTAVQTLILASLLVAGTAEAAMKKSVSFESEGQSLAGHLYLPSDYKGDRALPGVVVTGAWTTVKEQMPATYATALANEGFAVLTFDFRGWGESQGEPAYLEDPTRKTADIVAAAAFLASRPEVDAGHVGGLGICASSGYMSDAALQSPNIRALALVAPWLHDAAIVESVYGGSEGVVALTQAGRAAAVSDDAVILEAASATNENSLMYQAPYYTETDRGLIPEYDNKFNVASWEPWLTYDALKTADAQTTATLLVHSQSAAIPQGATEYARRMGDRARIVWLDDVSQFDFYDRPDAVKAASQQVADHFSSTFEAQQDVAAIETLVESVGNLADLGRFDALQTLFADEVLVDYSSLTGAPAATRTAAALMAEWASVLPGFDRTRHQLLNVLVVVEGDHARVTSDVVADHYIGTLFWSVRGRYQQELQRSEGRWHITAHRFELKDESGTRDVFGPATERAAALVH